MRTTCFCNRLVEKLIQIEINCFLFAESHVPRAMLGAMCPLMAVLLPDDKPEPRFTQKMHGHNVPNSTSLCAFSEFPFAFPDGVENCSR
jgi:hypothetical protein